MSDKELVTKLRGLNNYKSPNELTEEEKKDPPVYGNYLRVVMKDRDDNNIENVEDYMKLDEAVPQTLGSIEQFMYWQAKEPEGFEYEIDGVKSYAFSNTLGATRRNNSSDKYGHDYCADYNPSVPTDNNLCPGICLLPGMSGREIYGKVTGNTNPVPFQSWCTGEQQLDIYTQELQSGIEELKQTFPALEGLDEESDTRIFALLDVSYAGMGNMQIGTIYNKLKSGDLNLTLEDFKSNCTSENAFYRQNANGFTRRRIMDYYMYAEGWFCHNIYDTQGDEVTERWEFDSETPFQDLMRDMEGAHLVDI